MSRSRIEMVGRELRGEHGTAFPRLVMTGSRGPEIRVEVERAGAPPLERLEKAMLEASVPVSIRADGEGLLTVRAGEERTSCATMAEALRWFEGRGA